MKPILFNTEMVRAILEDRKTVTRRVVKDPCYIDNANVCGKSGMALHKGTDCTHGMPYPDSPYHPGDILWVRETFFKEECTPDCAGQSDPNECPFNRVGDSCYGYKTQYIDSTGEIKWRPSIHMPKEAARLFLRVTGVRVERLKEIDNAGARAEGCDGRCSKPHDGENSDWQKEYDFSVERFETVWDSTIKPTDMPLYGWEANPWVWVIEFERISKEAAIGGGGDG